MIADLLYQAIEALGITVDVRTVDSSVVSVSLMAILLALGKGLMKFRWSLTHMLREWGKIEQPLAFMYYGAFCAIGCLMGTGAMEWNTWILASPLAILFRGIRRHQAPVALTKDEALEMKRAEHRARLDREDSLKEEIRELFENEWMPSERAAIDGYIRRVAGGDVLHFDDGPSSG